MLLVNGFPEIVKTLNISLFENGRKLAADPLRQSVITTINRHLNVAVGALLLEFIALEGQSTPRTF